MVVYTVYKTTNQITDRFYIGMHKTANPNDSYLGSGIVVKRAIEKHGAEKFKKEVLFVFLTRKEAAEKEIELLLVEKDNLLCYNLHEGGTGGFEYVNKYYASTRRRLFKKARIALTEKLRTDPQYRKVVGAKISEGQHKRFQADPASRERARKNVLLYQPMAVETWRGQKHTKETRQRLSDNHRGEQNSMFGMRWMYNDNTQRSKRFRENEVATQQSVGWQLGRKFYNGVVEHGQTPLSRKQEFPKGA